MEIEPGAGLERAERWVARIAEIASWIWLALLLLIVGTVILRYALGIGRIELEELQWHLYAIGFLIGIAACAVHDRHVRVDVFRERMGKRARAWVDLYGTLLLVLPFLALVLWSALPFVAESFASSERSAAAGGLPHRWLLKATLPLAFFLLGIAALGRLLRAARSLFLDAPGERRE